MAEQSRKVPFWRSLQTQFALTYIVIIAAVLLVLNLYPVLVYQDLVFQSKQTSLLQDQASVIAATLAGPEVLSEKSAEGAVSLLGGNVSTRRVMVTDPTGLVLYDSSEVNNAYGQYALLQEITSALKALDSLTYGQVVRAKGYVPAEGGWIYFDYVPGEHDVRRGGAAVTGRVCVIGAHLDEDGLKELFHIG